MDINYKVNSNYLKELGRSKEMLQKAPANTPVGKAVAQYVETSIIQMKDALTSAGRVSSGELQSSINAEIKTENEAVIVDFIFADYWDFVNEGVNGLTNNFGSPYSFSQIAKVPSSGGLTFPESIKRWITERGLEAEDGNYEGLAWVIMQSVKRKGLRPSNFVNDVINDESIEALEESLLDAFEKMI